MTAEADKSRRPWARGKAAPVVDREAAGAGTAGVFGESAPHIAPLGRTPQLPSRPSFTPWRCR